ncbi:thioredoxin-dependent thiol peroxidase [Lipingzhangella sp. LS1_29]|uniref:thioredoxin-dependent peroxiredoxin n=1 Tax=Lipingzhangella rawalii TaxID=2055835 RepID=A0ABU2HAC1_9ACTN|nr:thioredoxin-dependent thiol peroxidase [Lipingzhangella rawalii]MDS1271967.1 thioredoxin-dependent thiol peroxidase [Lipingzhangella rawalii]
MTPTVRLSPKDPAPDFTLSDSTGKPTTLSTVLTENDRVVLYFYPKAMTPGCTTEACDFRDNLTELNQAGLAVLGISPDTTDRLARFRDEHHLTFPLLSDPDRQVMRSYGAYGQKKSYGRLVEGVIRSTFVIAGDQTIEHAMYNVKATGHVGRLLRELKL